jgi:hypothetical protein
MSRPDRRFAGVFGCGFGHAMSQDVQDQFFHTFRGKVAAIDHRIPIWQDGRMRLPIPKRQKTAALQDAARGGKCLRSSPVLIRVRRAAFPYHSP